MTTPRDVGPPANWSAAELAALSAIDDADVTLAGIQWRADAPPWARALLDATEAPE